MNLKIMEKEFNPLGWTTLEESERLMDAGLGVSTADMRYRCYNDEIIDVPECVLPQVHGDLPCWSLGSLLNILPVTINVEHKKKYCLINGSYVFYVDKVEFMYNGGNIYYGCYGMNLIESVVETVLWCLEKGYIEKFKKE